MRRFFWVGLAIWFVATLAIRFAGGALFGFGNPARLGLLFAATAPAIAVPVYLLARQLPTPDAGLRAAVFLILPGMLLDTGSVLWFRLVFPNLPASAGMPFASLMLWAYGVALLAGLLPRVAPR